MLTPDAHAHGRPLPGSRIFKTHASFGDLPVAGCTATAPPPRARVIVVVRDPRDVMVSLYYHSRSIKGISDQVGAPAHAHAHASRSIKGISYHQCPCMRMGMCISHNAHT